MLSVTFEVRGVESSLVVEQRPGTNALVSPVVIGYPPVHVPTNASVDAVDTLHASMTLTEGSLHGSHGGSVVGTGVYGHMDELGLGGDDEELRSLTSSKHTAASPLDAGVLEGLMGVRYADADDMGGKPVPARKPTREPGRERDRGSRARVQLPEGGVGGLLVPEGLGQPSASSLLSFDG